MTVRTINKERRRQRILDAARQLIIDGGYEGLTTRGLAEAAGLTVPTLYNLIGGKDEIVEALIIQDTEQVWSQWEIPDGTADLATVDNWIAACRTVIENDVDAIRAMILASNHVTGLYTHSEAGTAAHNGAAAAVALATHLCQRLQTSGILHGQLRASSLGEQLFVCFRDPLRDWAEATISLGEFSRRFARGTYMVLCADATDENRKQLINNIINLETDAAPFPATASMEQ